MSPLVVRRPPAVRRFQILSCAMQALAAFIFFRWYRDTGAAFDLAMAHVLMGHMESLRCWWQCYCITLPPVWRR